MTARDLVAFALAGCRRDLLRILLAGPVLGALGMLMPIAIGVLVDLAIPSAQRWLLLQLGAGLLVAAYWLISLSAAGL